MANSDGVSTYARLHYSKLAVKRHRIKAKIFRLLD